MYVYCFFCQTQRCRQIAGLLRRISGQICIYPQIIQRKWVKGQATEVSHDWLPGYVFLYSDREFRRSDWIDGMIRLLGNGPLKDQDLSFAMTLLRTDGIMGTVKLLDVGDRCVVKDPAWDGICGRIIKLDRNRKRCCIEYKFDENIRQIWVGYEMIEAPEEN